MSDHDSSVEITRLTAEVEKLTSELADAYTDLNSARQDNSSFTTEFKRLSAEVERLTKDLKTAIWSESAECKLLTRINAALLDAPTVDVDVVVPDRDYSAMTPKDCYEAGRVGMYQAREAIKAATRAALTATRPQES
jgi:predicted nuclease with TOPRIM domain